MSGSGAVWGRVRSRLRAFPERLAACGTEVRSRQRGGKGCTGRGGARRLPGSGGGGLLADRRAQGPPRSSPVPVLSPGRGLRQVRAGIHRPGRPPDQGPLRARVRSPAALLRRRGKWAPAPPGRGAPWFRCWAPAGAAHTAHPLTSQRDPRRHGVLCPCPSRGGEQHPHRVTAVPWNPTWACRRGGVTPKGTPRVCCAWAVTARPLVSPCSTARFSEGEGTTSRASAAAKSSTSRADGCQGRRSGCADAVCWFPWLWVQICLQPLRSGCLLFPSCGIF